MKINYLRNLPRGGGFPLIDKINTVTNIQQQTDKIDPNAIYNLLSLSVESADGPGDGPVDGPVDVRHGSVLHPIISAVGLGHAVPP